VWCFVAVIASPGKLMHTKSCGYVPQGLCINHWVSDFLWLQVFIWRACCFVQKKKRLILRAQTLNFQYNWKKYCWHLHISQKFMAMAQANSCWSFAMDALGFNSRSAYAGFLLQKVALGQVWIRALWFSLQPHSAYVPHPFVYSCIP